jgi:uncharacterized protein YceH (UPF0502 family)
MKIMKLPLMLRRLGLLLVGLVTIAALLVGWQGRSQAQVTVNLQADINDLRSQVSQLRSEVTQLRQRGYFSTPASSLPSSRRARSPELSDQQMLDRLATLAIEAKDRLNALEARVGRIESRLR